MTVPEILAWLGGTSGSALLGVIGTVVKTRGDVKKITAQATTATAEANKARAEADAKSAAAELVRAEMMQAAQNMIAAELGEAKGKLVRAAELTAECHDERRRDKDECDAKLAQQQTEINAQKGVIAGLGTAVTETMRRSRAIQNAMGISDETIRRFTPRDFPVVKPGDDEGKPR